MQLDPRTCYRALRTRDARFDGRFFTAVRSTGIYCRPICPAPTPKPGNCTFLPSAAAAQERGYRPCLRCRPEAAPGTPTWLGTSSAVSRALRLIAAGALDAGSVAALAARLGVGDRHLRRLFLKHLGASPVSVAQTQRILFAKRLIDDTSLPMAEIALAAGFNSVRRFNDAVLRTYGRPPRELRRNAVAPQNTGLRLRLAYRPPFRWRTFVDYLGSRATRGVESVDDRAYRRTVRVGAEHGWVEVRPVRGQHALEVELHLPGSSGLIEVADRVRRIFDLGAAPAEITDHLARDEVLGALARRLRGVRVPGTWDGFELAVRAVLGQQVTVRGASTLAARLADRYGEVFEPVEKRPGELRRLFPTAQRLARADLTGIGLPRARARTVSALADAVAAGDLVLEPSADPDATIDRLRAIPGVGEWTAQYVAMRALGHPDAFPAADLGLRRALARSGERPPSAAALELLAEAWRPWRAYAAFCLWLGSPTHDFRRNR